MSDVRIAHDTMGEMELPGDALWGASTQRAVLNFPVSGNPVPIEIVQGMAMLKWAAATANEESCLLYTSPSPRDQRGSRMPSSA